MDYIRVRCSIYFIWIQSLYRRCFLLLVIKRVNFGMVARSFDYHYWQYDWWIIASIRNTPEVIRGILFYITPRQPHLQRYHSR